MAEKKEEEKHIEVDSTSPLTPHEKALLAFGTTALTQSVDALKDFAKIMITLLSGLFASYFAILKFLGVSSTADVKAQIVNLTMFPPLLFIFSIIVFVLALLPMEGKVSLDLPKSIENFRNTLLKWKKIEVAIGVSLFIIGMFVMMEIFLILLA
ncbi:MAG: hypothetical protein WAN47_01415 [Nitrosotalea sp.]